MLPSFIRIGCFSYDIILTDEPIIVDNQSCKGMIDYDNHQIKIKKSGISEQQQEQTFWHEVIHGIIRYRNFTPNKVDEETCVDELAIGLYGVVKANRDIFLPGQK